MSDDQERHPFERLASSAGRTPAEVAALDRLLTGFREYAIARGRMLLEVRETTQALVKFGQTLAGVDARLDLEAVDVIATDPDLVELDVYLDGYYS